jgi:hypothetical protein
LAFAAAAILKTNPFAMEATTVILSMKLRRLICRRKKWFNKLICFF